MARPTYKITSVDYNDAWHYLNSKLTSAEYPSVDTHDKAYRQFHKLPDDAEKLNAWAEKYLDKKQWTSMKNAIRSRRKRTRRAGEVKNVSLSVEAWERLRRVADREGVTLSEAILKYLKR